MTRAAALALRTAAGLKEDCVIVVTDGPVIGAAGATSPTEIELNPTGPSELGVTARVHTTFDNEAWAGEYDIDLGTGSITQLTDNLGNTVKDVDSASPTVHAGFPWGNANWRDCYAEDAVFTAANAQAGLITNVRFVNCSVDWTGKTAGAWSESDIIGATIVTGPSLAVSRSRIVGGTFTNSAASGAVSVSDTELRGCSVTRNAAATAPMTLATSTIISSTIAQAAGAVSPGNVNVSQTTMINATLTQNGAGAVALFFCDWNNGTISNTAAATRGLSVTSMKLNAATISQQGSGGTGTDTTNNGIVSGSTVNWQISVDPAGNRAMPQCTITNQSVVNIVNPGSINPLQNVIVESQSILNVQAGGVLTRSRVAGEATLNTGAFAHISVVVELAGVTTLTAININRQRNKGFSDVILGVFPMALQDTTAFVVTVDTATSLPDPTLVSNREHAIVNTTLLPIVISSVGALPFVQGGVNVASITLPPGVLILLQSDSVRWVAKSSGGRAFFAGTAVTDASGNAVFNFPSGTFAAAPVVDTEIQFPASANPIDHRITALTATSCTINCKQSPTLIILSLSVLGIAANIAGVTVHLIATAAGATP